MELQRCPLTVEERHSMIAEAAYLKSEHGNHSGDPVEDWLTAETEFEDAFATSCRPASPSYNISAYHQMRSAVSHILAKAGGVLDQHAVRQALSKAAAELRDAGAYLPKSIDAASRKVREELARTIEKLGHNRDRFIIQSTELLTAWKRKGARTLNQTVQFFSTWAGKRRGRHDQ